MEFHFFLRMDADYSVTITALLFFFCFFFEGLALVLSCDDQSSVNIYVKVDNSDLLIIAYSQQDLISKNFQILLQ